MYPHNTGNHNQVVLLIKVKINYFCFLIQKLIIEDSLFYFLGENHMYKWGCYSSLFVAL